MKTPSIRNLRLAPLVALGLLLASESAFAQKLEFTPFAGFRFGGDFERSIDDFDHFDLGLALDEGDSYGFILGIGVTRNLQVELLYSTQETTLIDRFLPSGSQEVFDLDADYLHAGLAYQFATSGRVRPFVAGSLGITRLAPNDSFYDDDERFSVGLGVGVKVMLADHVGIRLEGRGFWTLLDEDETFTCDYDDYCYDASVTDSLIQGELLGGLIFAF